MPYREHLQSASDLVTPYSKIRAGFIQVALEKNHQATPYVEEAKALKRAVAKVATPRTLLTLSELRPALLTAAGVSDKAAAHLQESDQTSAILGLIENFLEPAGDDFVKELVFRFLLTKGDSLGGRMRNLAGLLAERRLTKALIATLSIHGKSFSWLSRKSRSWRTVEANDPDIDSRIRGLHWQVDGQPRTLIYNLTVPVVNKNVDLCLLHAEPDSINFGSANPSSHHRVKAYIALGELKGGIDPSGADEHWKTANSALDRIRKAFAADGYNPALFFLAAAIATAMAEEIYRQLQTGQLANAANLRMADIFVAWSSMSQHVAAWELIESS